MMTLSRKNAHKWLPVLAVSLVLPFYAQQAAAQQPKKVSTTAVDKMTKTSFQISDPWDARYDVRADVVMVYGVNDGGGHFEQRVKGWRDKGYNVQFMTGSAWGQYKDYFLGQYDGKEHFDEGQQMKNGETIWHGHNVPYVVPTLNFLGYLKTHIKRAIDAGVTAIYLEEPEFWARSGYSPAFKKEWQDFYHSAWQPEDSSPEATYLASKLKYHLYYRALDTLFTYAKHYSRSKGHEVGCFVPTHSLINYSSWQIVSPEASLASLKNVDGYIAQVWTGTAREPVFYNGIKKERVFENAFLEYGSMVSMTAPTHRKVYFLTDPIEDRARSWDDYKRNYQATFAAQLMYPQVADYEVMPWPSRIYLGKFKMEGQQEKQPISPAYATQMQIMVNALQQMPVSDEQISGSKGIGVLVGNSMMFQRFPTHAGYEDPQLSNFYGMALPLLEKGIPVETVHMENLGYPASLAHIKVLIMSYANMKPQRSITHKYLAKWVRAGGQLIYYGEDADPFQSVKEWWNTEGKNYSAPSQDLFHQLGLDYKKGQEKYKVGKGQVWIVRKDPKHLVMQPSGDSAFLNNVREAYQKGNQAVGSAALQYNNYFMVKRGPYVIAAVLSESENQKPLLIKGNYVDLFDPELPVMHNVELAPGRQVLLYDLNKIDKDYPRVIAVGGRVTDSIRLKSSREFSFEVKGPEGTVNSMRIALPAPPKSVRLNKPSLQIIKKLWDEQSHTLLLKFNHVDGGVHVAIQW